MFVHSLHGTYQLGMHPSASITWFTLNAAKLVVGVHWNWGTHSMVIFPVYIDWT